MLLINFQALHRRNSGARYWSLFNHVSFYGYTRDALRVEPGKNPPANRQSETVTSSRRERTRTKEERRGQRTPPPRSRNWSEKEGGGSVRRGATLILHLRWSQANAHRAGPARGYARTGGRAYRQLDARHRLERQRRCGKNIHNYVFAASCTRAT